MPEWFPKAFLEGAMTAPLWVQIWMNWMGLLQISALFFLKHAEARWTLVALVCNIVLMTAMAEVSGYNRLLGLPHILFWTPLLIFFWRRRDGFTGQGRFGDWAWMFMATIFISLLFDYADVARYLLGDRS